MVVVRESVEAMSVEELERLLGGGVEVPLHLTLTTGEPERQTDSQLSGRLEELIEAIFREKEREISPHLTPAESNLVHYLMENKGRVVTNDELVRLLANGSQAIEADYQRVKTFISYIRKKLGKESAHLRTRFGYGYEWVVNIDSSEEEPKLTPTENMLFQYLKKNEGRVVKNYELAQLLANGSQAIEADYRNARTFISLIRKKLGEESAHLRNYPGWGYEWSTNGGSTTLTHKEHQLLQYLMINAGNVCSLDGISDNVWGSDAANDTTIRATIYALRKKLGDGAGNPRHIENVPGLGYRIIAPASYPGPQQLKAP